MMCWLHSRTIGPAEVQTWGNVAAKDIWSESLFGGTGCRFRNARHVFLVSNLIHGPVLVAEQALVGIVARRNVMPASPNYGVEA